MAPVAFGTSLIATHFAGEMDAKRLRGVLALFVVIATVKMVWEAVG
jgi:uncharacterized membrane protein YfcA